MRKVHIYIDGDVLAVGFRQFVKRKADELELKGYVRNIEGSVEVVAEGEENKINELILACKEGPIAANVENVSVEDEPPNYLYKDFSIRP